MEASGGRFFLSVGEHTSRVVICWVQNMFVEDDDEFEQWKPTISEITELLHHLQLSPPHSDELISHMSDNSTSSQNDQSESDESSCTSVTLDKFDRAETVDQLVQITNEKLINRMKNNLFHEHLVEHFTRKQMTHVYSDKFEDQEALDEYLKTLKQLHKHNMKTSLSEDRWNQELSVTRIEIANEDEKAREIVQSIISVEREICIHTVPHTRQLASRRIENLISIQIGRIRKVSNFRLSHLKMRNRLILIEKNLHSIISSGPNLSKDDYERLEAEQHYYKQQLDGKTHHRIELINRKHYSAKEIEAFNSQILNCRDRIKYEKRRIFELRKIIKHHLNYDRVMMNRINRNRKIISTYLTEIHNFKTEIAHKDYKEWMEKITTLVKQMKFLRQSLSALKTNLILHGKNIELATNDDIEIFEKLVDKPSQLRKYS